MTISEVSIKNKSHLSVNIDDREYCLSLPEGAQSGEVLDVCVIFAAKMRKSMDERLKLLQEKEELASEKKEEDPPKEEEKKE